jgi:F-type H+-transporting ATPase subunit epsilon
VAHSKFRAEILTPEGEVFNDEVEMVSTRTEVGSLGILANHQPLLGLLAPTELRLYRSENEIVRYAQGEGYLQMTGDRVLLLVEEAIAPRDLNVAELQEKLRRCETAAEKAEPHSEAERLALRDKRRWEAFLRVADEGR